MEQQKDEKDKNSNHHINLKVREVIDQEEQTGSNSNRYVANAVRRGKEQIFYEIELNCKYNQCYNEARSIQLFVIFNLRVTAKDFLTAGFFKLVKREVVTVHVDCVPVVSLKLFEAVYRGA